MPSAATVKEYNSMPVQAVKEQERAEWVFRWLRVAELIAAESADAKLVYIIRMENSFGYAYGIGSESSAITKDTIKRQRYEMRELNATRNTSKGSV